MVKIDKKKIGIILLSLIIVTLGFFGGLLIFSETDTGGKNDKFYNENDPIKIIDGAGRSVSFPEPAKTVATSWGGVVDSYLFSLGLTENIVATKSRNNMHKLCMENMDEIPSVGQWDLDEEKLASIQPDVYLHSAVAIESLNGANKVNVRAVGLNFNKMSDIASGYDILGKIFGVEDRVAYLMYYYNSILDIVEEQVSEIPADMKKRVVVLGHSQGEIASSPISTIEEMIVLSGGISCVPAEVLETSNTNVGEEMIFKWNPDIIFIQENVGPFTPDTLYQNPNWASLTAVSNKQVYAIPCVADSWSSPSISSCLGVLYMASKMYPEKFDNINYEDIVIKFYKDVYNLELTQSELGF